MKRISRHLRAVGRAIWRAIGVFLLVGLAFVPIPGATILITVFFGKREDPSAQMVEVNDARKS